MRACGLIVEYNPFHYGHLYHIKESQKKANADCMIAVMSGPFLQRGEPAIVDKYHRAKAALSAGVDIVIELPYAYAVESSELFAEGAINILNHLEVDTVCFGSESGNISQFQTAIQAIDQQQTTYQETLKLSLKQGENFPTASAIAYKSIGLDNLDLIKPNNILGLSYVRAIKSLNASIKPLTIQRVKSEYHDKHISDRIASATSIRQELLAQGYTSKVTKALPRESLKNIRRYQTASSVLHHWERYFSLLNYQLTNQSTYDLKQIHGIEEGLEHRIKDKIKQARSFEDLLTQVKTKRYTQTRLQRNLIHILTHTKKQDIQSFIADQKMSYVRLLGMSKKGQAYLNQIKKNITIPIYTNLNAKNKLELSLDEKAQQIYYAILPSTRRLKLRQQEFKLPIRL